ncbi:PREDICTED: uncharacterized protein LOC105962194 [Erythranthe guttata]|uniref:uncharacterized protein LOC105962194 n=1 Tax=Erythranthe guttata TaxID=4155 RepID=UPI00064DAAAA|nr:PREDICTED: uncharacterized protein LOC105962194 [Erythranthe guttata]|eukprot:XP_012841952.1 PREDICTED: uncharacterized protein LOC105962194 [Erythranthe guttata]
MASSKKEEKAKSAKAAAIEKMKNKDFKAARKFAAQAQKLCPNLDGNDDVVRIIHVCDVHCSDAQKVFEGERDWYKIIDVDPTADMDSIKKQCQKLTLVLHPDKNKFPGAAEAFQLICEARAVLMDYEKRSFYDSKCRANALAKNSRFPNKQKAKSRGPISKVDNSNSSSKKKVAKSEKDGSVGDDVDILVPCAKKPKTGASIWSVGEKHVNLEDKEATKFASEPKKNTAKGKLVDGSENNRKKLILEYTESEFNDFEKGRAKSNFNDGQIWAVYDTLDSMPRFYALINKVVARDFKMDITWLEPCVPDNNEEENKWLNRGLPASCGKFRHGCNEIIEDHAIFSHLLSWNKIINYEICPTKEETWALFKNWDIEWYRDQEGHNNKEYDFEIVEILLDYCSDFGAPVVYLSKMKGYVSIFSRKHEEGTELSKVVTVKERLRFSHRVPSLKNEGENGDQRFFELDPAALPPNLTTKDV